MTESGDRRQALLSRDNQWIVGALTFVLAGIGLFWFLSGFWLRPVAEAMSCFVLSQSDARTLCWSPLMADATWEGVKAWDIWFSILSAYFLIRLLSDAGAALHMPRAIEPTEFRDHPPYRIVFALLANQWSHLGLLVCVTLLAPALHDVLVVLLTGHITVYAVLVALKSGLGSTTELLFLLQSITAFVFVMYRTRRKRELLHSVPSVFEALPVPDAGVGAGEVIPRNVCSVSR